MPRQRKVKKTLLQKLKKTVHLLTKPKHVPRKKTRSRKNVPTKRTTISNTKHAPEFQKIENELTRKMSEGMQKIKLEMEQELLEKLKNKEAPKKLDEEASIKSKKMSARKETKNGLVQKRSANRAKTLPRSNTDYIFLKVLTMSDSDGKKAVVGYEVFDHSNQENWGIDIHEGARLCRSKKIADTKLKSRRVGQERQYYLSHITDDTLYFSDKYAKEVLERGKITVSNYTPGLTEAIKYAFDSGYNNRKWRELK